MRALCLLAWNVLVGGMTPSAARDVASQLREKKSGLIGVRALALELPRRKALQISMNLEDPAVTAPVTVFERLEQLVAERGGRILETEIIGLMPDELVLSVGARPLEAGTGCRNAIALTSSEHYLAGATNDRTRRMKGVAKLKDEARKYEQKEEWEKAIDAYLQVLKSAEGGDNEADLPLYNRIGDLMVRLGKSADAVTYYEQAADQYAEAGLYNNAIALCNKALRYVPNRLELIRKLGQFSAAQGFLTDARRWYLEYAERQLKAGQLDDAFKSLEDFATVHEDAEIRELLGRQLKAHHCIDQAVAALKRAHALRAQAGQIEAAERLKAEILLLKPGAFEAGSDFEVLVTTPRPLAKRARQDDIEIWRPPPEPPPAASLELETAAGAAFGGAADETATTELPALETEESAQETTGFDVGGIELENTPIDVGSGIDSAELEPLIDVGGLGLEESLGGELPMLETGSDDVLAFEIDTPDVSSGFDLDTTGLDLEIPPTAGDSAATPLPFLILDDAEAAVEGMELPLLETDDSQIADFALPAAEADETASEVFDALPLETFDEPADSLDLISADTFDITVDSEPGPDLETAEPTWETTPGGFETPEPLLTPQAKFALEDETAAEIDVVSSVEPAFEEPELEEHPLEEPVAEEPVLEEPILEEPALEQPVIEESFQPIEFEESETSEPLAADAAVDDTIEPQVGADYSEVQLDTWTLEPEAAELFVNEAPAYSEPEVAPTLEPWQELKQGEELAASGDRAGALLHFDDLQLRFAADGLYREAWQASTSLLRLDPINRRMMQLRIDYANALKDQVLLRESYLDLARHLAAQGDAAQSKTMFQRVLEIDPNDQEARKAVQGPTPVASSGYVDLMAFIGEDKDEEASTRFVVAEQAPTGDEERDFADMLSQFKQKVAQHVSVGEASAHYDLGLAFKEMGLVDEAIGEFQTALKGGEERLKVYEELGQCFILKQQYNVAVTVLTRALQMPVTDESALVGVYYALGRCS